MFFNENLKFKHCAPQTECMLFAYVFPPDLVLKSVSTSLSQKKGWRNLSTPRFGNCIYLFIFRDIACIFYHFHMDMGRFDQSLDQQLLVASLVYRGVNFPLPAHILDFLRNEEAG